MLVNLCRHRSTHGRNAAEVFLRISPEHFSRKIPQKSNLRNSAPQISESAKIQAVLSSGRAADTKRQRLDKTNHCQNFLASLGGFEPPAFRLGARLFAVVPCRSVSVFAAGYGTFLRVRVDTGRYLSLSVSPFRRPFISSILVFSKNGKWADVAYKSLLAAVRYVRF